MNLPDTLILVEAWVGDLGTAHLLTALLVALPVCLAVISLHRARRVQRRLETVRQQRTPAFAEPLSMTRLTSSPGPIAARLSPLVRTVVVLNPRPGYQPSDSAEQPKFSSIVIDINAETHDLETGCDENEIAANAAWVAKLFGVPFRNETSGYVPTSPTLPDAATDALEEHMARRRRRLGVTASALAVVSAAGSWALSERLSLGTLDGSPVFELGLACSGLFFATGIAMLRRR